MKATDNDIRELLKLLKNHPDLVSALVLDPVRIQKLLKTKGARRVALGLNVEKFLRRLSKDEDGGGPIAQCVECTAVFCAGGTVHALCIGGTRPK